MFNTARSRGIFAAVAACQVLMLTFGILGYFVGFTGFAASWAGFWMGVLVALAGIGLGGLIILLMFVIMHWIEDAD